MFTINDLKGQFAIQGAYCISEWNDIQERLETLAEGKDFESESYLIKKETLDSEILYMYALEGVLHIEVKPYCLK